MLDGAAFASGMDCGGAQGTVRRGDEAHTF